ncbi:GNAT family N-acetyltransferase [Nonomuraea pusilla]|uniref:GNAT family N-acetyltransferase n=1 Tax=Nonomuraea pusilla TaxID=46177 RepID=UPI001F1B430D|nr:GNAT family N-acetyltransferase [Nonomuraea pusilla]
MRREGGGTVVAVRELHELADFGRVCALFQSIWGHGPGEDPISVEMMRAMSHAGNYVAGAFEGDRLVGASVGFFAAGNALHSHVTGATAGRGVGLALKRHQRDWALERGLERITWTYDPLVRRNAYFNLVKLGARPTEYLPRFYGEMADAINGGDESDRVLAVWELSAPHVEALVRGEPYEPPAVDGSAVALAGEGGHPAVRPSDAATVLVAVPEDVERLRRADPGAAKAWRLAVREVLGGLLEAGGRVTGFHDRAYYVVERA